MTDCSKVISYVEMVSVFCNDEIGDSESDAESLVTMQSGLDVIMMVIFGKSISDILFFVYRVHVICVWPNTELRILVQR